MDIIIGATGNVGSALAKRLLSMEKPTTIVTHSPQNVEEWQNRGATVAVVDIRDSDALRDVLSTGERLFMLNPPGDVTQNSIQQEKETVQSMLEALTGTSIKKVVAESTYGAQKGDGLGDLGVLFEMEEGLRESRIPLSVVRGAYYMSNWDMALESAHDQGFIYSLYPESFALPMVSPKDLGEFGAKLMTEPIQSHGTYYVEGPQKYSPAQVATAFSKALGHKVKTIEIPQDRWVPWMMENGMSKESAESTAKMTKITLERDYKVPRNPVHGSTTLESYISQLVHASPVH